MQIKDALKNRCVTCRHWDGDREWFYKTLNTLESESVEKFLDPQSTWCGDGYCGAIYYQVDAVFGCIFHEKINAGDNGNR
jgi:hypothetical protein